MHLLLLFIYYTDDRCNKITICELDFQNCQKFISAWGLTIEYASINQFEKDIIALRHCTYQLEKN
jgi:hypothetical protein